MHLPMYEHRDVRTLYLCDGSRLCEGMTLRLEPSKHVGGVGLVVGEEMVEVTATGAQRLSSRLPAELPMVAR
jgi:Xaa-Pro aminopeptidase